MRAAAGLPPRAPEPSVPGGFARAMHDNLTKVREVFPEPQAVQLTPGETSKLKDGEAAVNIFQSNFNLQKGVSRIHMKVPGDQEGFDRDIRPEEHGYQRGVTSEGGRRWGRLMEGSNTSIVISVLGYEILVDTLPNVNLRYTPEISEDDLKGIPKLKTLLSPDDASKLQEIVDTATKKEAEAKAQHEKEEAREKEKESAAIYIKVGRGYIDGGGKGLIFTPITSRDNPNIVLLSRNPSDNGYGGRSEKIETEIGPKGIGIPVPDSPEMRELLQRVSGDHLTIKIDGMEVTVIDGSIDGPEVKTSTNGTLVHLDAKW